MEVKSDVIYPISVPVPESVLELISHERYVLQIAETEPSQKSSSSCDRNVHQGVFKYPPDEIY